jgi:hypothetical protein
MIASAVHSTCRPRFQAGRLEMTPTVRTLIESGSFVLSDYLCRHLTGDWGDVDPSDRSANEHAILDGGALLSSYRVARDVTLRFITRADRSTTSAFMQEEASVPG